MRHSPLAVSMFLRRFVLSITLATGVGLVFTGDPAEAGALASPAATVVSLSAGDRHTCALTTSGSLVCWGDNTVGQRTPPAGAGPFVQATSGGFFTCGVDTGGNVTCWGLNTSHQTEVPLSATSVSQVIAGYNHVCALRTNGTVVCWGANGQNQSSGPTAATSVTQLAAGVNHTCALKTDGSVECWGYNGEGQIDVPPSATSVTQLTAGFNHTCALRTDSTVVCWGRDDMGETVVPPAATSLVQVTAGQWHTCAVKADMSVLCWGGNPQGQVSVPPAATAVVEVTAGLLHTCARKITGKVICWGYNAYGQATPPEFNGRPIADAGGPYAGTTPQAVLFDGTSSSDPDGETLTYAWDFDGDAVADATASQPSYFFPSAGTYTVSLTVQDEAGATSTDQTVVTITEGDNQPPSLICGTSDGLWHDANVALPCTASDSGTGLLHAADASFLLATNVAAGSEIDNAATGSRTICDVAGNCATAGPIGGNMVDKRPPSITITSPSTQTYLVNQSSSVAFGCTDGGSGVATCAGSVANGGAVNTITVGSHAFSVTAADAVGHSALSSVSYTVAYNVCLQYDPAMSHKAGSTVPIKLQLCDAAGNNLSASSIPVVATAVYLVSTSAPGPLADSGNANPDTQFRFAGGSYIFNLSLKDFAQGTYALTFTAGTDPTTHTVQFQVK